MSHPVPYKDYDDDSEREPDRDDDCGYGCEPYEPSPYSGDDDTDPGFFSDDDYVPSSEDDLYGWDCHNEYFD